MRKAKPKKVALRGAPTIDVYIGARMRERRLMLNMSLDEVGKELGVSFQQVQYEKGVNPLSASRLFEACRALNVSLVSMFERDPRVQRLVGRRPALPRSIKIATAPA